MRLMGVVAVVLLLLYPFKCHVSCPVSNQVSFHRFCGAINLAVGARQNGVLPVELF